MTASARPLVLLCLLLAAACDGANECLDGVDNDLDGRVDFPADPACFLPVVGAEDDPSTGCCRLVQGPDTLACLDNVFEAVCAELHASYALHPDQTCADAACAPLAGDLVAHYRFDDGAGDTAADDSGLGNDAAVHGAAWTQGRSGGALLFDGEDDEVAVSLGSALSGDFTLAAWIQAEAHGDPDRLVHTILSRDDGSFGGSEASAWDIELGLWNDGRLYAYADGALPDVYSSGSLGDSDWHHVALTRQGTSVTYYVDGRPAGAVTAAGPVPSRPFDLHVGADHWVPGGGQHTHFRGRIDDVRIHARALSAEAIDVLAHGPPEHPLHAEAPAELVFPQATWSAAAPEAQDVDGARLDAAMAYLASISEGEGVSQAMVVRRGVAIWQGTDTATAHNVWSVSKSFTGGVLGLLVDRGSASLESRAADRVPALAGTYGDVTLRHLVTQTSGYDAVGGDQSDTPFDPAAPLFSPPGSEFLYWDAQVNQLANVLTRFAGEPLADLFAREVAGPIGMDAGEWSWGSFGVQQGLLVNGGAGNQGRGISISARQLARFGLLVLRRGRWEGQQILSESWVLQATASQVPPGRPSPYPDEEGPGVYGFGWWANGTRPDGSRRWPDAPAGAFAAAGFSKNRCWGIPEWDMVIVRLGTAGGDYTPAEENAFLALVGEALE